MHSFTPLALLCLASVSAGDSPTLQERLDRVARELESAREQAHVPGMSITVVKDDEVVLMRGFGLADVETERAADENTLYGIGSTTKAFSATLLGLLLEENGADWDDPIRRHLPYFDPQVRSSDADAICTLRDVASHRHGFARMGVLYLGDEVSRKEVLEVASRAEPWDDFREGFHYSNVAYLAVGEAASSLGGRSWEDLMRERMLEPLGMSSTTLSVGAVLEDPRLAVGYTWDPVDERLVVEPMMDLGVIAAAGAMNSNVVDLSRWVRLLLAGGAIDDERILSTQALHETWEPQIGMGGDASYGLGWMLWEYEGRRVVEHGGNVDGFSAEIALMPEENLGYVLLVNQGASPLRRASLEIVFEGLIGEWEEEVHAEGDSAESDAVDVALEDYVGTYVANFAHFRDASFEVSIDGDRLALDIPSQKRSTLDPPDAEGRWRSTLSRQISVSFQRDGEKSVTGMVLHQGPFAFEAPRRGRPIDPGVSPEVLEKYTGTFVREQGGKRVEVLIQNGLLTMQDKGNWLAFQTPNEEGEAPLRARADQGATFHVDAEGNVESFVFHGNAGDRLFTRLVDSGEEELPTLDELHALRGTQARIRAMMQGEGQRITGTVRFAQAGVEGDLTIHTRGSDRYAIRMDLGKFGRIETAASEDRAWAYDPLRGHRELFGEELLQGMLAHPGAVEGDWSKYFDAVEVIGRDSVHGRPAIVVRLKKTGMPSRTYRIDAETGDVLRVNQTIVESAIRMPITVHYFDFEEHDGVRIPRRVEIENSASGKTILQLDEFEKGLELGDEMFVLEDPAAR